jgi:2-hydroxychromene-2-carboxylate isomerase
MTNKIDFYFDFISPYSYLAHIRLKSLNKDNQLNINYKPILLGGLHKLGGITAPAINERKMKNMKNDCELIAQKNNIEFKWNDKFPINSLYLMRGYLFIHDDLKKKYLNFCFNAYWKESMDILDEKFINKILTEIGIDKENFLNGINNLEIKDRLKKFTNEAFDNDIFGAPTFVVNKKIFWGQDRLDYALDEFNNHN